MGINGKIFYERIRDKEVKYIDDFSKEFMIKWKAKKSIF